MHVFFCTYNCREAALDVKYIERDMDRKLLKAKLQNLFDVPLRMKDNFAITCAQSEFARQQQTNDVFSDQWTKYDQSEEKERLYEFQRQWYLKLYGFASESELQKFLCCCDVILDAGCGLGYKAAWFAELAPQALVIGMDFSDAARHAAESYKYIPNLVFMQGDIANTKLKHDVVAYVSCDQVIMHTEDPEKTFTEFARICSPGVGQVACYFYAKKALPRELLDDYFRTACAHLGRDELWAMSAQLTELGRRLSELNVSFEAPDIPALGIKGGIYDIQRFIYWNFAKCFWNAELGPETSLVTNFDWYSPSNARRFSEADFKDIVTHNGLLIDYFHAEEACDSGRFRRGNASAV
jgi:ubiquinone/menaquinone biosynthesis C-methylase UbiE